MVDLLGQTLTWLYVHQVDIGLEMEQWFTQLLSKRKSPSFFSRCFRMSPLLKWRQQLLRMIPVSFRGQVVAISLLRYHHGIQTLLTAPWKEYPDANLSPNFGPLAHCVSNTAGRAFRRQVWRAPIHVSCVVTEQHVASRFRTVPGSGLLRACMFASSENCSRR